MAAQKNKPIGSAKPKGSIEVSDKTSNSMSNNHNITQSNTNQEFFLELEEFTEKFTPKHENSILLSKSYHRLKDHKRADRIEQCGSLLKFSHDIDGYGEIDLKGKLHYANFCRERLCPMCAWRKTLKSYSQVSQVMDIMPKGYRFIFLTLTIPNCTAEKLQETVSSLFKSWDRLCKNRRFKGQIKGFIRVLEITRNKKSKTYHPHFHCILAVKDDYFAGRNYISRNEYLKLWQKACDDDSITQVDVRVIRDKKSGKAVRSDDSMSYKSAIAETTKYTTKDSDFLKVKSDKETDDIVKTLTDALKGRRLIHYGGIFKDLAKQLKLEDIEKADLIHIDEDKVSNAVAKLIVSYHWSMGAYTILNSCVQKVGDIE